RHLLLDYSITKQLLQTALSSALVSFRRILPAGSFRGPYRTNQYIKNLKAVLESAGSSLEKIIKVNIFLADIGDFEKINEIYLHCVAVKSIPEYTDVKIKCVTLL
ncbi:hypothetical protein N7527_006218, partial [Penicillium freii]